MQGEQISDLLRELEGADHHVLDRLIPLVYDELRRLAHIHLQRERRDHPLSTTDLVHETFLRLTDVGEIGLKDRSHYFAIASRAMRRILVDNARRRLTAERHAGVADLSFGKGGAGRVVSGEDLIDLDVALSKLANKSARQSTVVELTVFGGLTQEEIAALLGVSVPTIKRDWRFARAWLSDEIGATA